MLSLTTVGRGPWPSKRQRQGPGSLHGCASPAGSMSSRKGLNGTCSVHEYTGTFTGQLVRFKMTSVCGHVMTLDFLGEPLPPCPPSIALRSPAWCCPGSNWSPGQAPGREVCPEPVSPEASRLWRADLGSLSQWCPLVTVCPAPSCAEWRQWSPPGQGPGSCRHSTEGCCPSEYDFCPAISQW